ncbi:RNA helicase [Aphelenchoides fujianensis]|nr:RNA helicase [Aphelenchoides fujianensis]
MSIKDALYAAIGRRKLGTLDYEFQQDRAKFRCQLSIPNINYVAMGVSTSKKDAQTNAATDMCGFLVREGILPAAEFPQLNTAHLELTNFESQSTQPVGSSVVHSAAPYAAPAGGQPSEAEATEAAEDGEVREEPPYIRPPIPKSQYEEYVSQRAEEVAQSESVDLTSDIHGGWDVTNCKKALNEFLQARHQPAARFHTTMSGMSNNASFVAECEIHVSGKQRSVRARGEGGSKKVAETSCALSIVRQLFHLGVLRRADQAISQKKKAADLPPIRVTVDPALMERLHRFLVDSCVELPDPADFALASPDARISLLTDQRLAAFPLQSGRSAKSSLISFVPPTKNWNPWRAANIDEPPLAQMSLPEISAQLLERERAKVPRVRIAKQRESLPVRAHRDEILRTIRENPVVLIKGTTGCGKSTQVCQYLLDDHLLQGRGAEFNCFVSQPRRISAISLAERVASERCEQVGESVGFGVRFESVTPRPYGAVFFCTVGTMLKKLEFGLRGVSHVLIDEIHERDINTDFLLIIVRDMVRAYPKLRVVLMSATIETGLFSNYFKTSAIVTIEQRVFPVQHFFLEDVLHMLAYRPPPAVFEEKKKKKKKSSSTAPTDHNEGDEDEALGTVDSADRNLNLEVGPEVAADVRSALAQIDERNIPVDVVLHLLLDICANGTPGAVLIFLPGWSTIQLATIRPSASTSELSNGIERSDASRFLVLPLHSQLPFAEQRRVFQTVRPPQRKIILSTNIAETSITIDDVVYVIDSCRAREKIATARNNLVHYATVWASRNSLIQRRGRAGRVREGFCFHLCTKARYNALDEHRTAEMLRTPLHEVTLMIKLLRLGAVGDFLERAIEPPPLDAIVEAEVSLREMGALDAELELTPLGRVVARLPVDPRMGKAIVLGGLLNIGDLLCTVAAATSFNTPFIPLDRTHSRLGMCHRRFAGRRLSDHVGIVQANNEFAQQAERNPHVAEMFCQRASLSATVLSMTAEAKLQMRDVLVQNCGLPDSLFAPHAIDAQGEDARIDLLMGLLVYAFYPNVCYVSDKRRKVFTLEQATALMSKTSVCFPLHPNQTIDFPSPLLVFTEKIRTNVVSAKQLSAISPLHLLLFGSRRVECVGPSTVRLDDMIVLEMSPVEAAHLCALRPCLESLIVRCTTETTAASHRSPADHELEELVRLLCGEHSWLGHHPAAELPAGGHYLQGEQQRARASRHQHYEGGGQGGRSELPPLERPVQRPEQRWSGFGRGGYRAGFRGSERPPSPVLPLAEPTVEAAEVPDRRTGRRRSSAAVGSRADGRPAATERRRIFRPPFDDPGGYPPFAAAGAAGAVGGERNGVMDWRTVPPASAAPPAPPVPSHQPNGSPPMPPEKRTRLNETGDAAGEAT